VNLNIFLAAQQSFSGPGRLIIEILRSHTNTHSAGLLWKSYRPVAKTSIWQHATFARDRRLCLGGIRTRNPSKRAAADVCLRTRCYRNRRVQQLHNRKHSTKL